MIKKLKSLLVNPNNKRFYEDLIMSNEYDDVTGLIFKKTDNFKVLVRKLEASSPLSLENKLSAFCEKRLFKKTEGVIVNIQTFCSKNKIDEKLTLKDIKNNSREIICYLLNIANKKVRYDVAVIPFKNDFLMSLDCKKGINLLAIINHFLPEVIKKNKFNADKTKKIKKNKKKYCPIFLTTDNVLKTFSTFIDGYDILAKTNDGEFSTFYETYEHPLATWKVSSSRSYKAKIRYKLYSLKKYSEKMEIINENDCIKKSDEYNFNDYLPRFIFVKDKMDVCFEMFVKISNFCEIPPTAASFGADMIYNELLVKNDYNLGKLVKNYLGCKIVKGKNFKDGIDSRIITETNKRKFLNETIDNFMESYKKSYRGGYNTCILPGFYKETTYDIDLVSAYPSALNSIKEIDFSDFKKVDLMSGEINKEMADKIESYFKKGYVGIAQANSVIFDEKCLFPNIFRKEEESLINCLENYNVVLNLVDVYTAVKLGAKINLKWLKIYETKDEKIFGNFFEELINLKNETTHALEKDCIKDILNTSCGKISQGISREYVDNGKIERSKISNPYVAATCTSFVRSVMCLVCDALVKNNFKVFSITTDGFITNARVSDVNKIANELDIIKYLRKSNNNRKMFEEKHENNGLLNISTRVNVSLNKDGVYAVQGGGKPSDRKEFIGKWLERKKYKMSLEEKRSTSLKEMADKNIDYSIYLKTKSFKGNYDNKRRIIKKYPVEVIFNGRRYTVENTDSAAWRTIDDYLQAKNKGQ